MTDGTADGSFTVKHARLTRVAAIANNFAWIVFLVNLLFVFGRLAEAYNSFIIQNMSFSQHPDFWGMLAGNPIYTASLFVDMLSIFLRGIVFGLALKGVSLGLSMIVETDVNYREKLQGNNNERRSS